MAVEDINIGQKIADVPVGDLIASVALGIAKAQWELNKSGIVTAELLSGRRPMRDLNTGAVLKDSTEKIIFDDSRIFFGHEYVAKRNKDGTLGLVPQPRKVSMLELGFTPTFYHFVETVITVKMAIKVTRTETTSRSSKDTGSHEITAVASSVDATYTNTYSYNADASSEIRTKLVPVPPPALLEERVRLMMDDDAAQMAAYREYVVNAIADANSQTNIEAKNTKLDALRRNVEQIQTPFPRLAAQLSAMIPGNTVAASASGAS